MVLVLPLDLRQSDVRCRVSTQKKNWLQSYQSVNTFVESIQEQLYTYTCDRPVMALSLIRGILARVPLERMRELVYEIQNVFSGRRQRRDVIPLRWKRSGGNGEAFASN